MATVYYNGQKMTMKEMRAMVNGYSNSKAEFYRPRTVTPPPGYLGPQQNVHNPFGPILQSFNADDAYLAELAHQNKLQAQRQDFRPIYGPISNVYRRGPLNANTKDLLRSALIRRNLIRRKTRSYYRRSLRRNTYTRRRKSYKDSIDKLCQTCI